MLEITNDQEKMHSDQEKFQSRKTHVYPWLLA